MKKKKKSKYLVRGAKEECERSIALNMKGDNKIFCKYIQSKTKTKENIPCIMDENGEIHTDDKEKVELLNKSKVCLIMRTLHKVFLHSQPELSTTWKLLNLIVRIYKNTLKS
jgi:hypothetical protein